MPASWFMPQKRMPTTVFRQPGAPSAAALPGSVGLLRWTLSETVAPARLSAATASPSGKS